MNTAGTLEALIPLCGGMYGTLLGFKLIKPRKLHPGAAAIVAQLRWLGPLVIVFGLWMCLQAYLDPRATAEQIVRGMREKVTLPAAVDEITRLDAFDNDGERIIYRMTITQPARAEADRGALIAATRQGLTSQGCTNDNYRRLLRLADCRQRRQPDTVAKPVAHGCDSFLLSRFPTAALQRDQVNGLASGETKRRCLRFFQRRADGFCAARQRRGRIVQLVSETCG